MSNGNKKVHADNNHLPLLFIVLLVCHLFPEGTQPLAVGAPWPCFDNNQTAATSKRKKIENLTAILNI